MYFSKRYNRHAIQLTASKVLITLFYVEVDLVRDLRSFRGLYALRREDRSEGHNKKSDDVF